MTTTHHCSEAWQHELEHQELGTESQGTESQGTELHTDHDRTCVGSTSPDHETYVGGTSPDLEIDAMKAGPGTRLPRLQEGHQQQVEQSSAWGRWKQEAVELVGTGISVWQPADDDASCLHD